MTQVTDNRIHAFAHAAMLRLLRARAKVGTARAFGLGAKEAKRELEATVDVFDAGAEAFVLEFNYNAIATLTSRQAARIQDVAFDGIRRGLNERDVLDQVRAVVHDNEGRIQAIARTELNRAANWGRYTAWKQSGLVREKEYVATNDDRVREGHLAADGERVSIDEPFTRGDAAGYQMPPIAPNCRCTAVPVTRFTGLALPTQATTKEIPGLRGVELDEQAALAAIWNRWAGILASIIEETGVLV